MVPEDLRYEFFFALASNLVGNSISDEDKKRMLNECLCSLSTVIKKLNDLDDRLDDMGTKLDDIAKKLGGETNT